eukprot:5537185-Amphidinium_carterae.1
MGEWQCVCVSTNERAVISNGELLDIVHEIWTRRSRFFTSVSHVLIGYQGFFVGVTVSQFVSTPEDDVLAIYMPVSIKYEQRGYEVVYTYHKRSGGPKISADKVRSAAAKVRKYMCFKMDALEEDFGLA